MSLAFTPLVQGQQIAAATTTYYTCPASTLILCKHLVLTNTTGGAITVNVYIVPSGASAGAGYKILDTYSVASHTAYASPEFAGCILAAGDTIQMDASSGASISANAYGVKQT